MPPEPEKFPQADDSLPASIDMDKLSVGEAFSSLRRLFHYTPALPDRLKNAGAYASERFRESATWFVPAAFRNSHSYSIFVRQMLDYVVSDAAASSDHNPSGIAASQSQGGDHSDTNDDQVFLARKAISGLLDMAALATFHLSPLTVMAIFSEVAYGWKGHMQHLGIRLKEQQIIAANTIVDDSPQLIVALEQALGATSAMFDQPLISIEGLKKSLRETQAAVAQTEPGKLLPLAEIDQLLRQMELAARFENASIWDVSATISVVALNHIQAGGQGRLVSLEVPGNIFQNHIIDHYWEGLRAIERQGLLPALSQASEPFLETFWANYAIDQKTWTEQLFSGELLKWGWSQLWNGR